MSQPRTCFYIDITSWNGRGYIPSLVTEGKPGHQLLAGDGLHASPWIWSTDPDQDKAYEQAKRIAAQENARKGLTPDDVTEIICSSMAAGR